MYHYLWRCKRLLLRSRLASSICGLSPFKVTRSAGSNSGTLYWTLTAAYPSDQKQNNSNWLNQVKIELYTQKSKSNKSTHSPIRTKLLFKVIWYSYVYFINMQSNSLIVFTQSNSHFLSISQVKCIALYEQSGMTWRIYSLIMKVNISARYEHMD